MLELTHVCPRCHEVLHRSYDLSFTIHGYEYWQCRCGCRFRVRCFRVGVVVPCHESDRRIFQLCKASVDQLSPSPDVFRVCFNDGREGLRKVVSGLFDEAFRTCDVVLKASADFYLSPHILEYVSERRVVSFTPLSGQLFDLSFAVHRLLLPGRTWSGCYSLPRDVWLRVRSSFDGSDGSVMRMVGEWKVKSFQYRLLRPYRVETTRKLLREMGLPKRLLWQLMRFKAVKL